MAHEVDRTIVEIPVSALRDNPRNSFVHADFDPLGRDAWLIADIKEHGVLMPLLVFPDATINEGWRRKCVAKHLGLASVPCIILQKTDENAAYSSAQLHRQMSLFAKCVLYRDKITALIKQNETVKAHNAHSDSMESRDDANMANQEWTQCEEVLGVSRRFLREGVNLLARLERMSKDADFNERQRGARIASIFRNRGLKPALRMLDVKSAVDDSDSDPDVIQWHTDDGDADATSKRRKRKSSGGGTATATRPAKAESIPVRGNWRKIADRYVTDLRTLLIENGVEQTEALDNSFREIEQSIAASGGTQKRAA